MSTYKAIEKALDLAWDLNDIVDLAVKDEVFVRSAVRMEIERLARVRTVELQKAAHARLTQSPEYQERARLQAIEEERQSEERARRFREGIRDAVTAFEQEVHREALDAFTSLLAVEFALGDGRRVTWQNATVSDHRSRIAYMQKKVAGIEQDIDLHQKAIDILEGLGVSSLSEAVAQKVAA